MKAKELRIGNLVCVGKKQDGTDEIGRIERLDSERYDEWASQGREYVYSIESDDYNLFSADEVYPISLTEKWLLKFGFGKSGYFWYPKDDHIEAIIEAGKIKIRIIYGIYAEEGIILEHIEHVHQLQNLIFALTGEELEIK